MQKFAGSLSPLLLLQWTASWAQNLPLLAKNPFLLPPSKKPFKQPKHGTRFMSKSIFIFQIFNPKQSYSTKINSIEFEVTETIHRQCKMGKKGGNHLPAVAVRWHHMFSVMSQCHSPSFLLFACNMKKGQFIRNLT